MKEVPLGQTSTFTLGTLWKMCLNPHTAEVLLLEQVTQRAVDFPMVSSTQVGQKWSSTYLNIHRQGIDPIQERYNTIARFDYENNTLTEADLGENCYPSEVTIVPSTEEPAKDWILTVVYDGNSHCSQLYIFDSERLTDEPVCILALPTVIPLPFHSTWNSAE